MQDWLAARAQATPNQIALYDKATNRHMTFRMLDEQVSFMCGRWAAAGIERGQHVGMVIFSHPLAVIQVFAAMRMGVIFVPVNERLTLEEIDFQFTQAQVDWVLPYGKAEVLRQIREQGYKIPPLDKFTIRPSHSLQFAGGEIDLDEAFLIIHTSGTSGKSKGAVLTYGNLFYSALASAYRIGHQPDDKWLCVLPLHHVGGLSILIRSVLYGITVDLREKFDVDDVNHALSHEDVTLASLVPTMLYRLLEARTEPYSDKLHLLLLGGAATSTELIERCIADNIPIATTYGLTEAASQVATTLPDEAIRKVGTVGKPLLFTQLRIVNESGRDVPRGEYGEIIVKSPTVMQGYYQQEGAIHEGWLYTGDIGYLDGEGDLFLVQRRTDLIVSGGENVYPAEIEAVLKNHPAIIEAAVFGLDDAEWGQRVVAAIILGDDEELDQDDVEDYSREHLAAYKIPRLIRFVDELPLTSSGKIHRAALKHIFEDA